METLLIGLVLGFAIAEKVWWVAVIIAIVIGVQEYLIWKNRAEEA